MSVLGWSVCFSLCLVALRVSISLRFQGGAVFWVSGENLSPNDRVSQAPRRRARGGFAPADARRPVTERHVRHSFLFISWQFAFHFRTKSH